MFQEHVLDLVQLSAWQEYNDDQDHHCHILIVIVIISIIPIPIPITPNLPPPFLIPFASTSSHLISSDLTSPHLISFLPRSQHHHPSSILKTPHPSSPPAPGWTHQWWKCHWSWRNPRCTQASSKRPWHDPRWTLNDAEILGRRLSPNDSSAKLQGRHKSHKRTYHWYLAAQHWKSSQPQHRCQRAVTASATRYRSTWNETQAILPRWGSWRVQFQTFMTF